MHRSGGINRADLGPASSAQLHGLIQGVEWGWGKGPIVAGQWNGSSLTRCIHKRLHWLQEGSNDPSLYNTPQSRVLITLLISPPTAQLQSSLKAMISRE